LAVRAERGERCGTGGVLDVRSESERTVLAASAHPEGEVLVGGVVPLVGGPGQQEGALDQFAEPGLGSDRGRARTGPALSAGNADNVMRAN
jgi:hypothetical protein